MASLYDTSKRARKFVLGFLVLTAVVLIFETVSNVRKDCTVGGCSVQNAVRFYMNPDRKFGEIPKATIPGISLDKSVTPSYGLESIFAIIADAAYVYKIDKPREKLGSFTSAQSTVELLGFNPIVFNEEGTIFTWETANSTKVIKYDKEQLTWNMTTNYAVNIEANKIKTLDTRIANYQRNAKNMIKDIGFTGYGLDKGLIDARYAKYNNGTFFSNPDPLQSDYVIINIYRELGFADLKPTDQLPTVSSKALIPKPITANVYTEDPRVGIVSMVVSNKLDNYPKDVFQLKYNDFQYSVDPANGQTILRASYLIITPEEAWTKISNGQGSLVAITEKDGNYFSENPSSIGVKKFLADRSKTELGYYEPSEWSGYVYPIYIFRGSAELNDGKQSNFVYYIEAIKRVD